MGAGAQRHHAVSFPEGTELLLALTENIFARPRLGDARSPSWQVPIATQNRSAVGLAPRVRASSWLQPVEAVMIGRGNLPCHSEYRKDPRMP